MTPVHWVDPPIVAIVLLLSMLATWHAAYFTGRYAARKHGVIELGMVQDSIGILLALLLAFEFSMANSRFDMRETLAVREASAIATCYARCDVAGAALRDRCRSWLREYAALNARVYAIRDVRDLDPIIARREAIQRLLWSGAIDDADTEIKLRTTFVLTGINELVALHNERTAARGQFVPRVIIGSTLCLCLVWAAFSGYGYGLSNNRRSLAWLAFAASVVLVVYITFDLDKPWGLISQVRGRAAAQQLLEQLRHLP